MKGKLQCMQTRNVEGINVNYTVTNVGPAIGGEAMLIVTPKVSILVDSGFGFCGNQLVENIKKVLNGRKLDFIFLSHSHYDHVLGSPYCKREWPDAQIVTTEYALNVMRKESARATMKKLNGFAARIFKVTEYEDLTDNLTADVLVKEGDIVQAGEFTFKVLEFPGHTRDSIGFYDEKEKFLLSCETNGVYVGNDEMVPQYLVGYQVTLDSMDKGLALDIRYMLLSHYDIIIGDRCMKLLRRAREMAVIGAEEVMEGYRSGMNEQELIAVIKKRYYTDYARMIQPEAAFDENAKYLIPMVIKELSQKQ